MVCACSHAALMEMFSYQKLIEIIVVVHVILATVSHLNLRNVMPTGLMF
jgi:hypothetical protein